MLEGPGLVVVAVHGVSCLAGDADFELPRAICIAQGQQGMAGSAELAVRCGIGWMGVWGGAGLVMLTMQRLPVRVLQARWLAAGSAGLAVLG